MTCARIFSSMGALIMYGGTFFISPCHFGLNSLVFFFYPLSNFDPTPSKLPTPFMLKLLLCILMNMQFQFHRISNIFQYQRCGEKTINLLEVCRKKIYKPPRPRLSACSSGVDFSMLLTRLHIGLEIHVRHSNTSANLLFTTIENYV